MRATVNFLYEGQWTCECVSRGSERKKARRILVVQGVTLKRVEGRTTRRRRLCRRRAASSDPSRTAFTPKKVSLAGAPFTFAGDMTPCELFVPLVKGSPTCGVCRLQAQVRHLSFGEKNERRDRSLQEHSPSSFLFSPSLLFAVPVPRNSSSPESTEELFVDFVS